MNDRQRPSPEPAFTKAADAAEAWRQQQIATLTETQRRLYELACQKAKEREEAKKRELDKRKQADIEERTRRKILESPRLELVLRGGHRKITEVLARRLTDEYFRPGSAPRLTEFEHLVRARAEAAAREIEHEHARQRDAFRLRQRENLDRWLLRFERAREGRGQGRESFTRAAVSGKAKTEFKDAAKEAVDRGRSEAIARTVAKVKSREEEERQRGERGRGRDRGR